MRFSVLFLLAIITLSGQSFRELTESRLTQMMPDMTDLQFHKYVIPKDDMTRISRTVRQRFFKNWLYTWQFKDNGKVHYAILDNVIGKVQPITFLVIFNSAGHVRFVEVLKYREAYGSEIKRQSFRDQFIGKAADSEYSVGSSIKNISGATISVHSITLGVRKLCMLLPSIRTRIYAANF